MRYLRKHFRVVLIPAVERRALDARNRTKIDAQRMAHLRFGTSGQWLRRQERAS